LSLLQLKSLFLQCEYYTFFGLTKKVCFPKAGDDHQIFNAWQHNGGIDYNTHALGKILSGTVCPVDYERKVAPIGHHLPLTTRGDDTQHLYQKNFKAFFKELN